MFICEQASKRKKNLTIERREKSLWSTDFQEARGDGKQGTSQGDSLQRSTDSSVPRKRIREMVSKDADSRW